jgi:hypothetical protein
LQETENIYQEEKNMKTANKIVGMFAVILGILLSLTMTAAAEPMAGVVDYTNPFSNYWVIGAFVLGLVGAVIIFFAYVQKGTESQKMYTYGFISIIVAGALFMVALYVPAEGPAGGQVTPPTNTAYALIVNPSNQTGVGSSHPTYYTWGVDLNTTTGLIANNTGSLTTNITISRTGGSVTDKVNCYIAEANIPTSDLGFDIIAKNSGIFRIAWASDGGASVTGLNKCTVNFPAETELSAHYATCGVFLSSPAIDNMADDGVDSATYVMTFESDLIGVIGTINVNLVINAFA